ncbi:hypothetical protein [Psychroflexus halocasei]|uniref:Lipoprotein n=1 Tax=Psychroflexus halocasei TaxID=908615 RepID=A0A1H4E6E1_9FLAO|nr:hypothetical protein [Psychroflexus halocasei]SEA80120.1 hypothetical protein SAMN05421540_1283 [Psychroflexus halocasei]
MSNKFKILSWIFLSSLLIFSCGSAIKIIAGIPKLNVYSQKEINKNIKKLTSEDNVIDVQPIKSLDAKTIKNFIYMSIPYRTYIFDKNDSLMCFNSETYCSISQLDSLNKSTIEENYKICNSSNLDTNIDEYLGSFSEIKKKIILPKGSNFDYFQYKILVFINTDIAKEELVDDWNYIYSSLNTNNAKTVFIRVWTDLNENWGLKQDAKAKFKVRKVKHSKGEYYMTIPKLPYKI